MKPDISQKIVRLCCESGSCEVTYAQYLEWGKLDYDSRERYAKLKNWGWEHEDALYMAGVIEEWEQPQEGAVLICLP